jgi:ATP-dependent helicase/nuclease subunit A
VVDFNDLIRSTVRLLKTPGIGEWIKFKLDQQVDHILVDEAQDTNAAQWDIVKALAEEFFAGDGAKSPRGRTLFTVGDFKQAIFGFQGTDPHEFAVAGAHFATLAAAAEQEMLPLSLSQSFRSSQPILDVTDAVLGELGPDALGLPEAPERHISALKGSGSVTVLPPVNSVSDEEEAEEGDDRLGDAELKWATTLAETVQGWTNGGLHLRSQDRPVEPGDVMILVRSRGELARLIVSRLHEAGVPVAGVDRLRLNAPIAVQDLLACIRFALQPRDDLSLACILVSPLIGWTQEQLYERAKARNVGLWQHLGDSKPEELRIMLDRADRATPYQFLESILSDPLIEGRKRLIARLGEEARDPIEELLNAALSFETQAMPSLQLFLDWFDRGDVDIKRDPAKPENAVRVMTVHGAKGLQAPVVLLADATGDPNFKRKTDLDWQVEDGHKIPLFRPKSAERVGSLATSADVQDAREMEEHWRLLYVAMTRAEEHLFVGGALKPKQQAKGMSDDCWHVRMEQALLALGHAKDDAGVIALVHEEKLGSKRGQEEAIERWWGALPDWAVQKAAQEARPPRPLAPSALGAPDMEASPPPSDERRKAAQRGIWLHSLFERLPGVVPADRRTAALRWLARLTDVTTAEELADLAISIIDQPSFAAIFSSDALAEAPLAGVVEGQVIAGTVDRLLVTDDAVLVVDFKTGRRVPRDAAAVSTHHKAQMGAYAAVLQGIFPGRTVRAALLYTSGPTLIELTAETLAAHKPGFSEPNQEFADAP